jgi:hypothetical protein
LACRAFFIEFPILLKPVIAYGGRAEQMRFLSRSGLEGFYDMLCGQNAAFPDRLLGRIGPAPENGGACKIDNPLVLGDALLPRPFFRGISLQIGCALGQRGTFLRERVRIVIS